MRPDHDWSLTMTYVRAEGEEATRETGSMGRRAVLRGALATAGALGLGGVAPREVAAQRGAGGAGGVRPNSALALARFLHHTTDRALSTRARANAEMST